MASWTEDTAAILLSFVIIVLALVAFLITPFDSVNESLIAEESSPGFSIDTWSEENSSRNAVATFLSGTVNSARPGRWSLNPLSAFLWTLLFQPYCFFYFWDCFLVWAVC